MNPLTLGRVATRRHRPRRPSRPYAACGVCSAPPAPWSRFCRSHQRRLRVYGHARAKPVRLAWLIHYAVKARDVLDRNAEHRGLQLALSEIDDLLHDALNRDACGEQLGPDFQLWLGLAHKSVTALDVLTMFCAALLYEQLSNDPAINERAYHHRVARAVVCLDSLKGRSSSGQPKDLAATGQRALGRFLVDRYGALGARLVATIQLAEERERERLALISTPLK